MRTAALVSAGLYVLLVLGIAAFLGVLSKCYQQAKCADEEEARRIARARVNKHYEG